jgi:chromosome segregation ATPase
VNLAELKPLANSPRFQIATSIEKMNEHEKAIADLTAERDDARKSLASAQEDNARLIKAHGEFKLEIHGLETQRGELRSQIASLESDNTNLRGELATLQSSYDALKADSESAEVRAAAIVARCGIVHGQVTVNSSGAPEKTLTQRALEARASQKSD